MAKHVNPNRLPNHLPDMLLPQTGIKAYEGFIAQLKKDGKKAKNIVFYWDNKFLFKTGKEAIEVLNKLIADLKKRIAAPNN